MTVPTVEDEYWNTQRERITIERAGVHPFEGQLLLVIHDDPPPRGTSAKAIMLLDSGMIHWLHEATGDMITDEESELEKQ
ncbi:hypothetical protein LCGC14_0396970 [marine sediment metagenome]|uniref:Uncharacterized protein n=1 Tax=marine sediment metagenome TaxID=412755 RepID=A0A0F9T3E4_9ZZZZ